MKVSVPIPADVKASIEAEAALIQRVLDELDARGREPATGAPGRRPLPYWIGEAPEGEAA